MTVRDFRGYGGTPPDPQWPGRSIRKLLSSGEDQHRIFGAGAGLIGPLDVVHHDPAVAAELLENLADRHLGARPGAQSDMPVDVALDVGTNQ